MARRSKAQTHRLAITHGALLLGLMLGACGGDDASSNSGGSSGAGASTAGSPTAGSSTGAVTGSGASSNEGATTSGAGAGGADDTATGGSVAGNSLGGGNVGGSNLYLRCESLADCKVYGGGKVCCVAGSMHFCTKPSACSGDTLP